MFVIRAHHLEALNTVAEEQFVSQVETHLRKNHHQTVGLIPEDAFRQSVEISIARARSNGLTMGTSITAFATIMFEIAPNFDEHSGVHEILQDAEDSPDEAIFLLSEILSKQDWEEISEQADQSVWIRER